MDRVTFSDIEYGGKKRKPRRPVFLERTDSKAQATPQSDISCDPPFGQTSDSNHAHDQSSSGGHGGKLQQPNTFPPHPPRQSSYPFDFLSFRDVPSANHARFT